MKKPPRLLELFAPAIVNTVHSGYASQALWNDVSGGLATAFVALPLALAFGTVAGVGPIAGLYGAIATGFFASLFGATHAQISGPTAPVSVAMGAVVASSAGNLAEAFTVVMLAGALQILFGAVHAGKYVALTPESVVSGFMTGIGVVVIIVQTQPFLGQPDVPHGVFGAIGALMAVDVATADFRTFVFAVASLLLIVLWPKRIGHIIPAPLGILIIGTALSISVVRSVPVIGAVSESSLSFIAPSVPITELPRVFRTAFILALLAAINTFLTSRAASSVTKSVYDADKDLVGQGMGNLAAGMIGALPGAGATMRTIVNLRSGGRTPVAGMLSAIVLLSLAFGIAPLIARVPIAVLAAILVKVGWDMIDWGYLRRLRRGPCEEFVIMSVTFGLTVLVDLMTAVVVGIILSAFVNSRWLAERRFKVHQQLAGAAEPDLLTFYEKGLLRTVEDRVAITLLRGSFSYASARELARRDTQPAAPGDVVIYDFSHSTYVNESVALTVCELIDLAQKRNRQVIVSGLHGYALKALDRVGALDRVPDAYRFDQRKAAIESAVAYCLASDKSGEFLRDD